jgi:hypothetical protein
MSLTVLNMSQANLMGYIAAQGLLRDSSISLATGALITLQ